MKAILLAAGVGKRFGRRTKKTPKCLIALGKSSETLLSRYLRIYRECGIRDVVIVVGHQREKIKKECKKNGGDLRIRFIVNRSYRLGSLYSLYKACGEMDGNCLIMDADVYFSSKALLKLLRSAKKTAFLLDKKSRSSGEEMMLMARRGRPVSIAKKTDPSLQILGEATGIFKICGDDVKILGKILARHVKSGNVRAEYEESFCDLMKKTRIGYEIIRDFWTEMDFEEDLQKIIAYEAGAGLKPAPTA